MGNETRPLKRAWLRWRQLTVRQRFTLLEAMALMPLAEIFLGLFRYHTLLAFLEKATPLRKGRATMSMAKARKMGELANIAAWRGAYKVTCLRRSLVLWWMLRRRGVDSQVRIGVRMENGEFASHAWVERGGVVLNDAQDIGSWYTVML
jgi:hypothetical protein